MGLSIDEKIRRIFELATLRRFAKQTSDPELWRSAGTILRRAEDLRRREKDAMQERYEARVAAERRRLIDGAGEVHPAPKPGFAATDRFDPEQTRLQAEQRVRLQNQSRIAQIDRAEANLLSRLLHAETPRRTFNRNARDGPEPGDTGPRRT